MKTDDVIIHEHGVIAKANDVIALPGTVEDSTHRTSTKETDRTAGSTEKVTTSGQGVR